MATKRPKAKGPEHSGPTFLEALGMDGRPDGYADVRALLRAHDAGAALPQEPLSRILEALRVFLGSESTDVQLQKFGRRARLRGKQGRRQITAGDAEPRVLAVVEVFKRERQLIAEGIAPTKARATATGEVAKARHRARKTMQDYIVSFGEDARSLLVAIDYAERQEAENRTFIENLSQRLKRENKS